MRSFPTGRACQRCDGIFWVSATPQTELLALVSGLRKQNSAYTELTVESHIRTVSTNRLMRRLLVLLHIVDDDRLCYSVDCAPIHVHACACGYCFLTDDYLGRRGTLLVYLGALLG